jgi:hypothetical protein
MIEADRYRLRASNSQVAASVLRVASAVAPLASASIEGWYVLSALAGTFIMWNLMMLRTGVAVDRRGVRVTNTWRSYDLGWTEITGIHLASQGWPFWTDYVTIETGDRTIRLVATGRFDFARSSGFASELVQIRDNIRSWRMRSEPLAQ